MIARRTRLIGGVALASAAVPVAIGIVRIAVGDAFAVTPAVVRSIDSGNPRALFREKTQQFASKKPLTAADYTAIRRASVRVPLSAEPFVLIATEALAKRQFAKAEQLLEEAERRNPRQRLARALLLERYVRSGQLQKASMELAALNRLVPGAGEQLLAALTAMAMDRSASDALAVAMRGDPGLGSLLTNLVQKGASTATVLKFAEGYRPAPGEDVPQWRGLLLGRLLGQGRFDEAQQLWARFAGIDAAAVKPIVRNPSFARGRSLWPFDWTLTSDEVGVAEFSKRGSVVVDYYGRRSGDLMTQLLTLQPGGAYRLSFRVEGSATGRGSRIGWRLRCAAPPAPAPPGKIVLDLPLQDIKAEPRDIAARFVVPAGCRAQWLSLVGEAAEFPTSQSVEISRFALRADGKVK